MWGGIDLAREGFTTLHLGKLKVCIRQVDDEWRFSYLYDDSEVPGISPEPGDGDWVRLVTSGNESLELSPVLPDRPLVIRPESAVSIFPKRFAGLYVAVPVWYRFTAISNGSRTNLIDIPSRNLSNTWFGDPSSGELCYSLDAPLRRSPERLEEDIVICSLSVRNGSADKLDFERICVHVENLSIFADGDGCLWTNEIQVFFKGAEQMSQLTIRDRPPGTITTARKLSAPREIINKNILRKSFNFIRSFTDF